MNLNLCCGTALLWIGLALGAAAPGVVGGDSPELTSAAFALGPAHSPGYPLYILLGHLFQLLPLGTPAFRMTVLSILVQAGAYIVLTGTLRKLSKDSWSPIQRQSLAMGAACLLMSGTLVFRQALSPEVVALHFFFVALLLRFLLFHGKTEFLLGSFLGGLSLSHHHLSLLLAPAFLWAYRDFFKNKKFLVLSVTFFTLGLSAYLLLPLRSILNPAVNWGHPSDFHQFLFNVGRGQYGGDITSGSLLNGFWDLFLFLKSLSLETYGIGLILASLGLWKNRTGLGFGYFLGLIFLLLVHPFLIRADYNPENNYVNEAFIPPLLLWISPLVLRGLEWAVERFGKAIPISAFIGAGVLGVLTFINNNSTRNLAVTDVTEGMLLQLPAKSVLYSDGDAVTFPLAYLKLVLGKRPDLEIFDRTGGLFRDIYHLLDYRNKNRDYIREMVAIEHSYEAGNHPPAVFYTETDRIPGRSVSMTGLLFQVSEQKNVLPAGSSVWERFRIPRVGLGDDYLSRETAARFHLFKATYHFELQRDFMAGGEALTRAKDLAFDNSRGLVNIGTVENVRGWTDEASVTFEKATKVDPRFYLAWHDRGIAAGKKGRGPESIAYFQKAIKLFPGYAESHEYLAFQYYKAQRMEDAVGEWQKVIHLDPNYAEAYRNLGFAMMQMRPSEAAGLFREYLRLNPKPPDLAVIRKFLSAQDAR